jgi:hypothetical protein
MIDLASPEGEAKLKDDMERRARVMRWMAVPMGTQVDLFPKNDPRPITEKADAEGFKAGLCRRAAPQSVPSDQRWQRGLGEGLAGRSGGDGDCRHQVDRYVRRRRQSGRQGSDR